MIIKNLLQIILGISWNAEQIKYSLTDASLYSDKTAFTTNPANFGEKLDDADIVSVFMQLLIPLIDETFRCETTKC